MFREEKQQLENLRLDNFKPYTLVSNYGFLFEINGIRYDLRKWNNCYGDEVSFFTLEATQTPESFDRTLDTFEQVVKCLEELKSL